MHIGAVGWGWLGAGRSKVHLHDDSGALPHYTCDMCTILATLVGGISHVALLSGSTATYHDTVFAAGIILAVAFTFETCSQQYLEKHEWVYHYECFASGILDIWLVASRADQLHKAAIETKPSASQKTLMMLKVPAA